MAEFGLFNDEGMVEGQFHTREAAEQAREGRYNPEDQLEVAEVCREHEGEPAFGCLQCGIEDQDE